MTSPPTRKTRAHTNGSWAVTEYRSPRNYYISDGQQEIIRSNVLEFTIRTWIHSHLLKSRFTGTWSLTRALDMEGEEQVLVWWRRKECQCKGHVSDKTRAVPCVYCKSEWMTSHWLNGHWSWYLRVMWTENKITQALLELSKQGWF